MSARVYTVDEIKALATPVAKRHGVAALYLFGSYARGEATPDSDLDFRVEKGRVRSMFELGGLYDDLERVFHKNMDIMTTQILSPEFLADICTEEVLIYAQN